MAYSDYILISTTENLTQLCKIELNMFTMVTFMIIFQNIFVLIFQKKRCEYTM